MGSDSVMAYWIEADNFEFRCQSMGSADTFRGGTYVSEVITKYARFPHGDILIIPLNDHGSDWAKSAVERLKSESVMLREKRPSG